MSHETWDTDFKSFKSMINLALLKLSFLVEHPWHFHLTDVECIYCALRPSQVGLKLFKDWWTNDYSRTRMCDGSGKVVFFLPSARAEKGQRCVPGWNSSFAFRISLHWNAYWSLRVCRFVRRIFPYGHIIPETG